jgi:hypothetical protein
MANTPGQDEQRLIRVAYSKEVAAARNEGSMAMNKR